MNVWPSKFYFHLISFHLSNFTGNFYLYFREINFAEKKWFYSSLNREREERMMQQRINPTSRLTMRVNATDLFERYMYDELYDDVIEPSLPTLEITEISFAQTIEGTIGVQVHLMTIIFFVKSIWK